jgi:hypothetical protein
MSKENPVESAITFENFLAVDDFARERFDLPEAYGPGAHLYVKTMTGEERSRLEVEFGRGEAGKDPGAFRWAVLHRTVVDRNGTPFFKPDDRARVMEGKAASTIESMFEFACKLNGLGKKDVEELEGN